MVRRFASTSASPAGAARLEQYQGGMLLRQRVRSKRSAASSKNPATRRQWCKNTKCAGAASRLGAELLNASVDTCEGMAANAHVLVRVIEEEGER